jgi:hypothetical protein
MCPFCFHCACLQPFITHILSSSEAGICLGFGVLFFNNCTSAWTQGLHLEPLHQPFFVMGFFRIGSCKVYVPGWLQTTILISAPWVARITGMSQRAPGKGFGFFLIMTEHSTSGRLIRMFRLYSLKDLFLLYRNCLTLENTLHEFSSTVST